MAVHSTPPSRKLESRLVPDHGRDRARGRPSRTSGAARESATIRLRGGQGSGAPPRRRPGQGRRGSGRNSMGCPRGIGALHVANGRLRHMVARLRPRLEDRRLPVAGAAARRLRASTTRPTSTTTSFPASATTGRDSTAACAPARLGRNLAHLVNTVATWSRTKVEVGYARSDLFERRGASNGGLGCLPTGQRGLRPCPNPDWPTSCATLQFNTIRATRPDGPWPRGAATDGEYESLKRSADCFGRPDDNHYSTLMLHAYSHSHRRSHSRCHVEGGGEP